MNEQTLSKLILERSRYRKQGNFVDADALRKYIENTYNCVVEDKNGGETICVTADKVSDRKKRKREEESLKQQKQRQKQYKGIDLKKLKEIPRARTLRNKKLNFQLKKQKARFFHFAEFIKLTFLNDVWFRNYKKSTITCMDICGGSGNLSWEILSGKHLTKLDDEKRFKLRCIVVDPKIINFSLHKSKLIVKQCNIDTTCKDHHCDSNTEKNLLMAKGLHPKIQKKLNCGQMRKINNYLHASKGFEQITTFFNNQQFMEAHKSIWNKADLIIGLHPDEATDDIIEMSMQDFKPFVCVPCCVFPNKFPNRKLKASGKVVRSLNQLIEYIMEKADETNQKKHLMRKCMPDNVDVQMLYVVKKVTIEGIPGPCNEAIYGKYYVI